MSLNYFIADPTTGALLCSGRADTEADILAQALGVAGDVYLHDGAPQLDDTRIELVSGALALKSGVTGYPDPSGISMETLEP